MKKDTIIMVLIVVLVGILIFVGSYSFFTGRAVQKMVPESFMYNGFNFTIDPRNPDVTFYVLHYSLNGKTLSPLPFRNDPREIEDIPCEVSINDITPKYNPVYITQDPELEKETQQKSVVASLTMSRVLDGSSSPGIFPFKVVDAYTQNNTAGLPVVTCTDSTEVKPVIYLKLSTKTGISKFGENCILVHGPNGDELIKAAERLVYGLMGVIK